jgi:hypothetical protein
VVVVTEDTLRERMLDIVVSGLLPGFTPDTEVGRAVLEGARGDAIPVVDALLAELDIRLRTDADPVGVEDDSLWDWVMAIAVNMVHPGFDMDTPIGRGLVMESASVDAGPIVEGLLGELVLRRLAVAVDLGEGDEDVADG